MTILLHENEDWFSQFIMNFQKTKKIAFTVILGEPTFKEDVQKVKIIQVSFASQDEASQWKVKTGWSLARQATIRL